MDPERDPWPGGGDEPDEEPGCPMCEALPTEPHGPHCPMFAPRCACGRFARRMVAGEWWCSKCAPQGRVQGRAV